MKTQASRKTKAKFVPALVLLAAMAIPAAAQESCTGFAWPLKTEIDWMTSPAMSIASGGKIQALPGHAIALKLAPSSQAELPFKPGVKKQAIAPDSFSGWFEVAGLPEDGLYQITISSHAWIDAVQNGELTQSKAFTGAIGCEAVRKSVRYQLVSGPLTVQISGAPAETVNVVIREAK